MYVATCIYGGGRCQHDSGNQLQILRTYRNTHLSAYTVHMYVCACKILAPAYIAILCLLLLRILIAYTFKGALTPAPPPPPPTSVCIPQ